MRRHIFERILTWGFLLWSFFEAWRGDMSRAMYYACLAGIIEIDDLFGKGGKAA